MTPHREFAIALCEQQPQGAGGQLALCRDGERLLPAFCRELPPAATAPEWIEILPHRGEITGIDGRRFVNDNPEALVDRFNAQPRKPMIDWEHCSEKSWSDVPAPAAGWTTAMEVRENGSVWLKVDWTPRGSQSVKDLEYRYISPAFFHDKEGNVLVISSAALTNRPNLRMTALNNAATNGAKPMDPEILKALGLPPDASPAAVAVALNALKAKAETAPKLDDFVPRADYDLACNRAKQLEQEAKDRAAKAHADAVDLAINEATKAGKITPATADFYRSTCATTEGLASFRKFVEAAPTVAAHDRGSFDRPAPGAGDSKALNADEQQVIAQMGLSRDEFLAARNEAN